MIRVAFLGRSGHAYVALQSLAHTTDARLVAYAPLPPEEPPDYFDAWKSKMGDARGYSDYRELLEKEKPDLVQVSGAFYQNGEVARVAAEHGANVLVEKPIATSLDLLRRLKETVDRAGVRLTAMLGMRLEPPFVAAKRAIKEGLVGEPVLVHAQKSYKFGTNRPLWYGCRATYGGSIPWITIHMIDMINWLLGDPFANVTARHAIFESGRQRPECEDVMAILFGFKNGGCATINGDYLRPNGAPTHGDDRIRVVGTRGIIEVLFDRTTLIDHDGVRELPLEETGDNIFLNFVRHLAHGTEHVLGPNDAFRSTEVALKARESADQGGKILDLLDTPYR
ncbi:MAG: Gfo/Idh/MocA family oxidoreductase [Kiritimatiellae bacterium]|nr:Gfo/Idh/MocA family oxidoreductase [Kiritimatiellia bacterium]